MKAVFIDADHCKVEDIEINFSGRCGLGEFYEKIGNGCRMVQAVPYDDKHDLVLDEEALLRGDVYVGFRLDDRFPYTGNGIIVGLGAEDWASAKITADDVREKVSFFSLLEIERAEA